MNQELFTGDLMAFRGSELHNSDEQGRLEYSEEVDQAGNESDQGTNPIAVTFPSSSRVHDAAELQSDQLDYMKDKKKALVSSPSSARVHEESDLPSDESDNLKALLSFPSSRVHDASELPSDESDDMKKMPLARMHDWSELPRDVSNLIGDKMRFFPHLQKFGSASKEWRGIACEIIKTLPAKIKNEPPVLLLPYNQKTQTATFFEIKNCKKYDLKMPELKEQWICGASNGWLVMLDRNLDLFLFNTGSRARIKLPPLPPAAIAWFNLKSDASNISERRHLLYKAVLSGDPSSSDCLIAISYSNFRMIGVCRLGDEDWTVETDPWRQDYVEILLYQGKFFAVVGCMRIHVFEYHKQGDLRMLKEIKQPLCNPDWPPYLKSLVETCGDLFHIRGRTTSEETWGFEVYRFEPNSDEKVPWCRVYSLGDRSLFLEKHTCICMSVKEFPWCKPNCIYYNDDGRVFGPSGYEGDNGVYSLEENRVVARFDFQHPIQMWPYPAIWFRLNV